MANNYEQIMALVNAGNKMGLSNTITRDNGIPLDLSSVHASFNEAVIYAATKAIAYHGQILAAEGTVYVISAESQGQVEINGTTYENYLKPVGTAPTGDNASITVTADGLVSVFGFAAAQDGMLPVREDGKLTWKTLEAIGAGDGNDNTTYEFALNTAKTGIVVTPKFNGQPVITDGAQVTYELALDVYTKAEADEKFLAKSDYKAYDDTALTARVKTIEDDYLKAKDKYDDTVLAGKVATLVSTVGDAENGLVKAVAENATAIAGNVTAIANEKTRAEAAEAKALSDAKAYTDAEIDGLKVAIEQKENVEYIVLKDKDGGEIASVNASKFVQDSFLDDVAYNAESGKITFTWTMGDGSSKTDEVAVADFVQTYTNGTGLTLTGNQFAVDTSVIATVEALNGVKATAEAAQTAEEVSAAISAKFTEDNLAQYAIKETVENALAGKVDNATLASYLTAEQVAETYATKAALGEVDTLAKAAATKTYVDNELANKINADIVYTKNEIDAKIGTPGIPAVKDEEGNETAAAQIGTGIFASTYSKAEINDLLDKIEGGSTESAASVGRQLDEYKSTTNAKITAIETKNGEQDTAITAAKTQADKGVTDAAAAKAVYDAIQNAPTEEVVPKEIERFLYMNFRNRFLNPKKNPFDI